VAQNGLNCIIFALQTNHKTSKPKPMTTLEIIANFMKGSSKASISEKQKDWLLGQAKKDGISVGFDGWSDTIYFKDCFYQIRNCKRLASGGSYVGTRVVQGRYNIEVFYTIRFTDTGHTFVHSQHEVERVKREGYQFEIIEPHKNTNTR
jgi:hypothetical protein